MEKILALINNFIQVKVVYLKDEILYVCGDLVLCYPLKNKFFKRQPLSIKYIPHDYIFGNDYQMSLLKPYQKSSNLPLELLLPFPLNKVLIGTLHIRNIKQLYTLIKCLFNSPCDENLIQDIFINNPLFKALDGYLSSQYPDSKIMTCIKQNRTFLLNKLEKRIANEDFFIKVVFSHLSKKYPRIYDCFSFLFKKRNILFNNIYKKNIALYLLIRFTQNHNEFLSTYDKYKEAGYGNYYLLMFSESRKPSTIKQLKTGEDDDFSQYLEKSGKRELYNLILFETTSLSFARSIYRISSNNVIISLNDDNTFNFDNVQFNDMIDFINKNDIFLYPYVFQEGHKDVKTRVKAVVKSNSVYTLKKHLMYLPYLLAFGSLNVEKLDFRPTAEAYANLILTQHKDNHVFHERLVL